MVPVFVLKRGLDLDGSTTRSLGFISRRARRRCFFTAAALSLFGSGCGWLGWGYLHRSASRSRNDLRSAAQGEFGTGWNNAGFWSGQVGQHPVYEQFRQVCAHVQGCKAGVQGRTPGRLSKKPVVHETMRHLCSGYRRNRLTRAKRRTRQRLCFC